MTDYRALASFAPINHINGTFNLRYTLGHEFYVTSPVWLRGIWYYRGDTSVTATPTGAVFQVDANGLNGALVKGTSVAFSAGASTGWLFQAVANPIALFTGRRYRVAVYYDNAGFYQTTNFWTSGSGSAGITNGPLVFPSAAASTGAAGQANYYLPAGLPASPQALAYPNQYSPQNLGVDVTVTDVVYPTVTSNPTHISNNPTWTNTVATPLDAIHLENLESVGDSQNPFAGFATNKLYIDKRESLGIPPLTEQTLLYVQGPGIVKSLWMALGGGGGACLDGRLRVYYDGSTTPSIDIDFGTLYAMHFGGGVRDMSHNAQHMHIEMQGSNFNMGLTMNFPMPFGTSIRVAYYYPQTTGSAAIYSMLTYCLTNTDRANGIRLRCQGTRYMDQAFTVSAANAVPLCNITSGPGWVVWHAQVGGINATNYSWMERNTCIQIDGESITNAQIVSTGGEDWFDSAWYYENVADQRLSIHAYTGAFGPGSGPAFPAYAVGSAINFLSKWGGIPFNTSCVMTLQPEPACNANSTYVCAILYYN